MNQQFDPNCDPVEITDKKTGLKKLAYLCTRPIKNKFNFYKENKLHFWTDASLIATIALLLFIITGLWHFNTRSLRNAIDFSINYNADELINGQRVHFDILYKNTTNKKISSASVLLRYPDGLLDAEITHPGFDSATNTINLGAIGPNASGHIDLKGLMLSDIGRPEKFLFVLNYLNEYGQAQQEFSSKEFVVEKSIVDMSLNLPNKLVSDSIFESQVSVHNTADYTLDNLSLSVRYPGRFEIEGGNNIKLLSLNPGEKIDKQIIGTLKNTSVGKYNFEIALIQEYQGKSYILNKATRQNPIVAPKVIVSFVNTENNKAIKPGEQTELTIKLENNNNFGAPIRITTINLLLSGDFLDKNFLEKKYSDKLKGSNLNLTELFPKEMQDNTSSEVKINLSALSSIFINENNKGPQDITAIIRLSYSEPDGSKYQISSTKLSIPLNSKITPQSSAIFFSKSGDQVGVGSIPPKVGEYTAYWATIKINTGVNSLRDVYVRGKLGVGVEFTNQYNVTDGSPIRYIPNENAIEWYLSELESHAGVLTIAPEGRILLAISPSENQVGQIITLLRDITITAKDGRSGETITAEAKNITTEIFSEPEKNRVSP